MSGPGGKWPAGIKMKQVEVLCNGSPLVAGALRRSTLPGAKRRAVSAKPHCAA